MQQRRASDGDARNEAQEFVAAAEKRLEALQATGALRGDPYQLALGVLVACVRAIAAVEVPSKLRADLTAAVRAGAVEGAAAEARSLARGVDRRSTLWLAACIGCAFMGGAAAGAGALLANGSQWDAAAQRFYAAMPVCRAASR